MFFLLISKKLLIIKTTVKAAKCDCRYCWHLVNVIKSQIATNKARHMRRKFTYCYHLFTVISLCLFQSDHIKQLPLYYLIKEINKDNLKWLPMISKYCFFDISNLITN